MQDISNSNELAHKNRLLVRELRHNIERLKASVKKGNDEADRIAASDRRNFPTLHHSDHKESKP